MAESTLEIVVQARDEASKQLDGLKGRLSDMEPTFKKMAIAGTAAFAAIGLVVKQSIDAAAESAQVTAQLEAVIRSTGAAAGLTAQDILDQASALQKMTTFSDEAVTGAANLLLTFTNIKGAVLQEALPAVLDMSQALGQDLKSSSIQLGKALNDPIEGINALRRVGVSFTDDQQKVIASLVKTGQTAEAQRLILQEISKEFGGSAAAAAQTFAGKMQQLNIRIGDIKENIGKALIPVIEKVVNAIAPVVEKIVNWIEANPKLTAAILVVVGALAGLVALVGTIGLLIAPVVAGFGALGAVIGAIFSPIGLIVAAVAALVAGIVLLVRNWDTVVAAMQRVIDWVGNVFMGAWNAYWGAYKAIWDGIVNVVDYALAFLQGLFTIFMDTFFPGWQQRWEEMKTQFTELWNSIKLAINTGLTAVKTFFISIWSEIKAWWDGFSAPFKEAWTTLWTSLANAFTGVWESIKGAFKSAMNWIIDGINKMINAINRLIEGINKVATVGGRLGGGIPTIPNIPQLAEGGIITRPTLAMVGEGNEPEAVIPLSKLAGLGAGGMVVNISVGTLVGQDGLREFSLMVGDILLESVQDNVRVF